MPRVNSLPPTDRALYSQLHQILSQSGLVLGSLVTMRRTCGKENCRCSTSKRHRHRSLYLSVRLGKKRRLLYVPADWEERVTEWVRRSDEIRGLLAEISKSFVQRLTQRKSKQS